jgi:hypothetical protein
MGFSYLLQCMIHFRKSKNFSWRKWAMFCRSQFYLSLNEIHMKSRDFCFIFNVLWHFFMQSSFFTHMNITGNNYIYYIEEWLLAACPWRNWSAHGGSFTPYGLRLVDRVGERRALRRIWGWGCDQYDMPLVCPRMVAWWERNWARLLS